MTIHFYLDNKDETTITIMYDIPSNPFKVEDIISLSVEDICPIELKKYKREFQLSFIKDVETMQKTFGCKSIRLVRENKYINILSLKPDKITIEYHCEIVNK